MADQTFLILGGGGMIGFQIAHRIARHQKPQTIIIASLHWEEVHHAVQELRREFPNTTFVGFDGDVFVRTSLTTRDQRRTRQPLMQSHARRAELFEDLFGDLEQAYQRSQLVQLILTHKPDVIVDSINTATAISYQDVYTATAIAKRELDAWQRATETDGPAAETQERAKSLARAVESLMISQYTPQLIRHVILLNRAMREAGTRLYIKVGTTGTGGMGLNIPYTHGEDKPSAKLMSKTAIAFAHTGLLFLMARTEGGPIVKEVKPAAMVGWLDVAKRSIEWRGKPAYIYAAKTEHVGERLALRLDESTLQRQNRLQMVVADTGENGLFTKGEFEAITALRQMEFMTPEEIARVVELEIKGINTGKDVIAAIDGAVMGPTYRAGYLRHQALADLQRLEERTGIPSVALGELGPPELSKLLWEAYLLKQCYGTTSAVLERNQKERGQRPTALVSDVRRTPEELSSTLTAYIENNPQVRDLMVSVGTPILYPDGKTLVRGPFIRIPEVPADSVAVTEADMDAWARKGWVDLRPQNMAVWLARIDRMRRAREALHERGSAAVTREAYLYDEIHIGEVVGWVFNNEMGGYRIK